MHHEQHTSAEQSGPRTSAGAWGLLVILAVIAGLVFATAALAQMPQSPWKKAAPFPEPDEELYGVAANGKLYVISGFGGGKGRGVNYEYDPATDTWTKKQSMPRPAHHPALATYNGKIYVLGGFVAPEKPALPVGAEWEPIDNAWEYNPAADSWKELAPLPGKRGAAVAAEGGGKIYVLGGVTTVEGAKGTAINPIGPSRDLTTNDVYDPATNKWESRKPMAVGRNHAFAAAVNGKIYVIGGRTGHGFITKASNTDVVEEYDPATDLWSAPKERMPTPRSGGGCGTDGRKIYVAGGEVTTQQLIGAYRAVEAYEPATDSWTTLPSMPLPRHGVAGAVVGNRFHLVSGMIQSAGALVMQDPKIEAHTAAHDVLELPGAKREGKAFYEGPKKPYTRYHVNSPEGKKMLAKLARAIHIMRQYPDYDPQSYTFWWYTHWIDGPSAHLYEESMKHKAKVIAQLPPKSQALADVMWNSCQSHTQDPADPDHYRNDLFLPWHRLYLYHFEQMVREVLQDDDFSIPYWNPASEDVADQALPAEFREKGSPLYNPTRFPWVQEGQPIQMLFGNWISLHALNETFYIDKLNGGLGFCPQVDINPHSLVHMSIGGDMGQGFARVVNDPIFWPHHANIDRVWESWNRLGHKNPTDPKWLDRKFPFPDRNGKRVDVPVSAVNRIEQLGYEYDRYAEPPKRPVSTAASQASPADRANAAEAVRASAAPAWSLPDGTGKSVSLGQYKGRPVVVIFYVGSGCIQCMVQLNRFAQQAQEFADLGIDLVAISTESPDDLKNAQAPYQETGGFPFPLLSDAKLDVFKAYRCLDFDNQPLHGTFLIDAQGRVRWRDISNHPFTDSTFVLTEAKQLLSVAAAR